LIGRDGGKLPAPLAGSFESMNQKTRNALIEQAYREHKMSIIRLGIKEGLSPEDQVDMLSETFIAYTDHLTRNPDRQIENLGGYLYTIARNKLIGIAKKNSRYQAPPVHPDDDDSPSDDEYFDWLLWARGEDQPCLESDLIRAEKNLKRQKCWEQFRRKYGRNADLLEQIASGRSRNDIAQERGCTLKHLRNYLFEAKKKLSAFLARCLKP
jgi:DNA-directed RNA polymerase specialized sigma24 family protein